jgi:hypothetical protein
MPTLLERTTPLDDLVSATVDLLSRELVCVSELFGENGKHRRQAVSSVYLLAPTVWTATTTPGAVARASVVGVAQFAPPPNGRVSVSRDMAWSEFPIRVVVPLLGEDGMGRLQTLVAQVSMCHVAQQLMRDQRPTRLARFEISLGGTCGGFG